MGTKRYEAARNNESNVEIADSLKEFLEGQLVSMGTTLTPVDLTAVFDLVKEDLVREKLVRRKRREVKTRYWALPNDSRFALGQNVVCSVAGEKMEGQFVKWAAPSLAQRGYAMVLFGESLSMVRIFKEDSQHGNKRKATATA